MVISKSGSVRFVSTSGNAGAVEKLIDYTPELVERISALFKKEKEIAE